MDGDWDVLAAKAEYATTPLELMALAELNDAAFRELCTQDGDALRGNLELLAQLVPPSCMTAQEAHEHLEPKVARARRKLVACESTCASYERAGAQLPLIGKVGFLKLTRLTEG